MKHPEVFAYTGNERHNARAFTDAYGNTFYFSYRTLIAFQAHDGPLVVHLNVWSKTTGRHLNAIDGGGKSAKAKRLSTGAFEAAYAEAFGIATTSTAGKLVRARDNASLARRI